MTTSLLGFDSMNYNVVYAQMGRGKMERNVAFALASIAGTVSKMAFDACMFSSQNFGFVKLPDECTTGSSIMPHKKNPDVFELTRAKCNKIQVLPQQIMMIMNNLPSGYFRDLQIIKEVFLPAFQELKECLQMAAYIMDKIKINEHILDDDRYLYIFSVKEEIRARVDTQVDAYGGTYYTQSVEEVNPQIFAWLDLLDMNVWVILFLMTGVAGFTMISGLLIIILERTNMIGVLKALGADNFAIRKIFLSFSVFLIDRGMVWGNIIGVALCFIQSQFHLFKLDPATYYVDRVPIEFNIWIYLLLNVCTLLVSVLMLLMR